MKVFEAAALTVHIPFEVWFNDVDILDVQFDALNRFAMFSQMRWAEAFQVVVVVLGQVLLKVFACVSEIVLVVQLLVRSIYRWLY
jgi:hypothetical protein